MGKRTRLDSDDYECIAKKVKKLNRKLMRARKRRRRTPSSSSSSSDSSSSSLSSRSRSASPRPRSRSRMREPSPPPEPINIEDVPSNSSEGAAPLLFDSAIAEPQPTTDCDRANLQPPTSAAVGSPTSELNEDLLKILGEDPSQSKVHGNEIQPDLAIRLQHVAASGLTKEVRKELIDRYLTPSNCTLIDAPALNPEVKAAVSEATLKRDKAIEQKQKQLSAAMSCLAEAMTKLLTRSTDTTLIKMLMDASRLLCDAQYLDSVTRRNFVLSNLKKELKDQLQATKIDKLLFSEELSDTLKAAQAISKSGANMKPTITKNTIKHSSKSRKNLNWKAPPPSQYRPKANQRRKEPAYKNRHESSSKQSSHPAPSRSHHR